MAHRGVVITAGFNRSKSALTLAERFKSLSVPVKGFIVVSPYSFSRLSGTIRKRGVTYLTEALPRLIGRGINNVDHGPDYLHDFIKLHSVPDTTLRQWAQKNGSDFLSVHSINDHAVVQYLKEQNPTWLMYCGGGIIKPEIIDAVRGRILNAHQGPLPEIRGMNACEWAILLQCRQEVTIHLIDHGIDTGKIITAKPFSIQQNDTVESLRSKAIVKGIEGLIEVGSKENLDDYALKLNHAEHRQCYILSPQMKQLLNEKVQFLTKKIR